jgi:hypothetical protein
VLTTCASVNVVQCGAFEFPPGRCSELIVCTEPIQFTWTGGTPPYFLSLIPGTFYLTILLHLHANSRIVYTVAGQISASAVGLPSHLLNSQHQLRGAEFPQRLCSLLLLLFFFRIELTLHKTPPRSSNSRSSKVPALPGSLTSKQTRTCKSNRATITIIMSKLLRSNIDLKDSTGTTAFSDIVTINPGSSSR